MWSNMKTAEWLDCLARCSLLAFDYQPPPVHVPTLDFKAAYHTAAKQLWLRDAAAGGGGGSGRLFGDDDEEEELQMPAAVNEAMGNEDRPHYDEVGWRDGWVSEQAKGRGAVAHKHTVPWSDSDHSHRLAALPPCPASPHPACYSCMPVSVSGSCCLIPHRIRYTPCHGGAELPQASSPWTGLLGCNMATAFPKCFVPSTCRVPRRPSAEPPARGGRRLLAGGIRPVRGVRVAAGRGPTAASGSSATRCPSRRAARGGRTRRQTPR